MNTKQKNRKKAQLVERDGIKCCWCGKTFPKERLTVEHLIPISQSKGWSGKNSLDNLSLACLPCNRSRGDRLFPPSCDPSQQGVIQLSNALHQLACQQDHD